MQKYTKFVILHNKSQTFLFIYMFVPLFEDAGVVL